MAKRKALDLPTLVRAYQAGSSALRLAAVLGVSLNTVLRRLREKGVVIRQTERQPYKRLGLTPVSEGILREVVDGLLLGDGSILKDGSLRLGQCSRRSVWLEDVQRLLSQVPVPSKIVSVRPRRNPGVIQGREIFGGAHKLLYTPQFFELRGHRSRWYAERKRVPLDLVLTPLVVALWFCGDGSYHANGTLLFCTNSFLLEDVERLVGLLSYGVGISSTIQHTADGPTVMVNRRDDAVRLKEFMGPHLPEVFQYKVAHVRPAIPRGRTLRMLHPDQVLEIRRSYTGRNGTDLGRKYGVSKVTINRIVRRLIYRDL